MNLLPSLTALSALAFLAAASPGTLSFPIAKSPSPSFPHLSTRQALNSPLVQNNKNAYYIPLTLGTPPQSLSVTLDTGSADFIVIGAGSSLCDGVSCAQGTYNQSASSSWNATTLTLNNKYGDGTTVQGNFVTEVLGLNGVNVSVDVAVAMTGSVPKGIPFVGFMGMGYDSLEGSARSGTTYPNIMDSLTSSGTIGSNTFSLWLDDLGSSSGTILFGGVDTSKFTGNLSIINILPSAAGNYVRYNVALYGITSSSSGGTSVNLGGPQSVVLDSGTSVMFLPQSVLDSLMVPLGLNLSPYGQYFIGCSASNSSDSLSFQLGGPSGPLISIAVSELVGMVSSIPSRCLFGIQPAGPAGLILGDTFLRSAYVVYNLQDNVVAIGQTNTSPGPANIIALNSTTSGTISIPSATLVPNQITPTSSPTGGAGIGPLGPTSSASAGALKNAGIRNASGSIGVWMTGLFVLGSVLGGGMTVW